MNELAATFKTSFAMELNIDYFIHNFVSYKILLIFMSLEHFTEFCEYTKNRGPFDLYFNLSSKRWAKGV